MTNDASNAGNKIDATDQLHSFSIFKRLMLERKSFNYNRLTQL